MHETITLTTHDGAWALWVRVCPTPGCDCGRALVLATRDGKELLDPLGQQILDDPGSRSVYHRAAALVGGPVIGFALDLDTGRADSLTPEAEIDDEAFEIADEIDGRTLDALHQRSRVCKGLPAQDPVDLDQLGSWEPGILVDWGRAHPGDRNDAYLWDDDFILCDEAYCVTPGCRCARVLVRAFLEAGTIGTVEVDYATGSTQEAGGETEWWADYLHRHPDWRARLAERHAALKPVGASLGARYAIRGPAPRPAPRARVGRNDPCPCGSGRKFKRCCGVA